LKNRHRRLSLVLIFVVGVATAVGLTLTAFNNNLVFFFSPSQIASGEAPAARSLRVGGLVEAGSLRRGSDGLTAYFTITDTVRSIRVVYSGILPDLFKEGRGCVAQGKLGSDGTFHADLVLARHDENYMPIEAARSIEDARRSTARSTATLVDR
jgi:cytochrome c-type biogenesis protein CcmE